MEAKKTAEVVRQGRVEPGSCEGLLFWLGLQTKSLTTGRGARSLMTQSFAGGSTLTRRGTASRQCGSWLGMGEGDNMRACACRCAHAGPQWGLGDFYYYYYYYYFG